MAICGAVGAVALLGASLTLAAPGPAVAPPASIMRGNDFILVGQLTQGGWIRGVAPVGTQLVAIDGKPLGLSPDGRFFAAFDRDATPVADLIARRGDLPAVRKQLAIAPRAWSIERVNTPFRPGALPDADFLRIRAGELVQIATARSLPTAAAGWRMPFIWPAIGRISGKFGAQRIYQGKPGAYHAGLDIAVAAGTPYVAPADGVVVLAASSPFTLEGNLLIVDHGMGLSSAFLHSARLAVKVGDRVRQGQVLGYAGMTGRASGPHLHWALKWREARLDPLLFVAGR